MTKRTPRALKLVAALNAELAAAGKARGEKLSRTAAEVETRSMLAPTR
jgi:hypothetical protein